MAEEIRAFICPACGEPSKSAVFGRAIQDSRPDTGPPAEFALLQCGRATCQSPMVQLREDFGRGFEDDTPTVFFPSPRRLSNAVPRELRAEFAEARKCFEAKAYGATVVMIRRTLEGTCAHQGSQKRTLAEGLKELRAQGKIDGTLGEWADLLRLLGNEGAHYTGTTVSAEDAADALDFTEALLDHLFVLRARFNEFEARQSARRGSADTGP